MAVVFVTQDTAVSPLQQPVGPRHRLKKPLVFNWMNPSIRLGTAVA
jgi:hypothetical protein